MDDVEQLRDRLAALTSERDFYTRLLELGGEQAIEPLLDQALALIVDVTGATKAYLELHDDAIKGPGFWRGHGCTQDEVDAIRATISRGIIARVLSEGQTIETSSAMDDERFQEHVSVRRNGIQAVLCAPVGTNPPIGVIYLEGRTRPGPFQAVDRTRAELFARQLAPLADRLVARKVRADAHDFTQDVRQRFRCDLVGRSRALAKVLLQAALVAPLDVDVLITGPSGTGKSALAQAIAQNGRRAGKPFVVVNCAALPETLIESELFGAEKGAHSTATRRLPGKVSAAEGGTLFLDEIAELSAAAQAKLLHLLQSRAYHPLGASTAVRANVRIISATNADLPARVKDRGFREDLYYRLSVMPLEMPGLGERRDDIPELVEYLVGENCAKHQLPSLGVSRGAILACQEAEWPGHVRQLANVIEAAVIRASGDHARAVEARHAFPADPSEPDDDDRPSFQLATRRFQRRLVSEALARTDWNISACAKELDVARSHVYNLINEFALKRTPG